jgi:predicted MFS family arabinose efflux permease
MTATSTSIPRADTTVALLSAAAFFSGAALRVCDALLPRLAQDFGVTPGTAGQVIIGFSVAYGFMQLVFGPLGDRYGKARLMCAALFGGTAGSVASAFAPSFSVLVLTRIAWGMCAAGIIPLAMAWIGDAVPFEQRQTTLARFLTGMLSGMMAGQLAGGLFADSAVGWKGAFLTLSAGYGAVALLMLGRIRSAPRPVLAAAGSRPALLLQLRSVLQLRWSRIVLSLAFAEGLFLLGPLSYLPTYLHVRHQVSLTIASSMVALYAAGGLVYAMTARHILRRLGERRMVLTGGFVMGAGFLAWWLSPLWQTAGPVALIVGFGTYLYHNTLQTHGTQMAPTVRGTSMALFAFSLFVGQALGVTLAGFVFDRFGDAPMLLLPAVALPIAGFAFSRALKRRVGTA